MKVYEVTLGSSREWFSTKQGALSSVKELRNTVPELGNPKMETLEIELTKKGVVAVLNKVAPTINPVAPEETKTVRITANRPPVPEETRAIEAILSIHHDRIDEKKTN